MTTRAAIERLPPEVTLSFVPYADNLQSWIDQARAQGHEVMLEMPMEPTGYPDNDPGPYTLLADGGADDVAAKMDWLLSRATGYFGVTNYLGDRFASSDTGMNAFLTVLRQKGVAFLDDGSFQPSARRLVTGQRRPHHRPHPVPRRHHRRPERAGGPGQAARLCSGNRLQLSGDGRGRRPLDGRPWSSAACNWPPPRPCRCGRAASDRSLRLSSQCRGRAVQPRRPRLVRPSPRHARPL
ncbi:divergent polysaccharide deacetylase family protein [Brevundimonas sp.]|uniref:divergent polysaccharide deacetylase family protein n=1 Tax=Brevundimonas sp. TaxID=1871086 RepID=UPI003B002E14